MKKIIFASMLLVVGISASETSAGQQREERDTPVEREETFIRDWLPSAEVSALYLTSVLSCYLFLSEDELKPSFASPVKRGGLALLFPAVLGATFFESEYVSRKLADKVGDRYIGLATYLVGLPCLSYLFSQINFFLIDRMIAKPSQKGKVRGILNTSAILGFVAGMLSCGVIDKYKRSVKGKALPH